MFLQNQLGEYMRQLFSINKETDIDNKYSTKVDIPQYLPSKVCPKIWELYDKTKYNELVRCITVSKLPDDVKEFLMFSATRHIVFNYAKIADYYAHADVEVQKLMEQSALVIIDVDDAIANGYMRLSENIKKLLEVSDE